MSSCFQIFRTIIHLRLRLSLIAFNAFYSLIIMENLQSICMSEYSYKDNLIYTSKDSEVYKAINAAHPMHEPYIFKGYPESYLNDPLKEKKLMQELNSLWKLHGKDHIVQIISQHSRDKKVFIIMQFCKFGTLALELKSQGKYSEEKSIAYIQQIIKGYHSIYEAQLIHRNLEPSSIFNAGLQLKIGDFSDSIKLSEVELISLRQQIVGNVHYQPFETLSAYKYSTKSDIYSIGAILFCMLKGRPPYEGNNKAQIIANMKNANLKTEIDSIRNKKLQVFLQRTLDCNEESRMGVEELISFDFELPSQISRLKLFTFDDREGEFLGQPLGNPIDKNASFGNNSFQKQKPEESLKRLFKNFDTSEKRLSLIDLKISDEDQLSRYYKDKEISIYIPTKLDLMNTQSNQADERELINNLHLEHTESIVKRPSEGLPLNKKAGTYKDITNSTYHDLLKSQTLAKNNRKNETSKQLRVITEKSLLRQTNGDSQKIKETNLRQTNQIEKKPSIHAIDINHSTHIVPPLEFKADKTTGNCNQSRENQAAFYKNKLSQRSNIKGPFTLRGRQNVMEQLGKRVEPKSSLIASWLISQIDMFRFLNRVLFRIKKAEDYQLDDLSTSLTRCKCQILKDVRGLKYLQKQDSLNFEQSQEYSKVLQIVQAYESKKTEAGQFEGYQKLNRMTLKIIEKSYNQIINSSQFKEELIKLLDYLITLWQLLTILKKNNIEYFHNKSKIQQILDTKECKLTIGHLLQLNERMKILKLI